MTWSIYANATKSEAIELVHIIVGPTKDAEDRTQFETAKDLILANFEAAPEGAFCTVSSSGHAGADGAYISLSLRTTPAQAPEPA